MKKPQKAKITFAEPRLIPLNKLVLSNANVRQIKRGVSIEDLAADIARRGLLQNPFVRPMLDNGEATETYEILAGGRRYLALQLLVKQKLLAKDAPVPCTVRDSASDIEPEDDSLAENIQRESLHPLDQFRAFKKLKDKGQSEEEIAAHFFVPVTVVRQRLRLVTVSEKLLEIFADDGMKLDQLMAFTVSDDHARQEQVWDAVKDAAWETSGRIRQMLTENDVPASDKRARFVGIDAYKAAGGTLKHDLFTPEHEGYLENVGLLDGLVTEKLKAEAEKIAQEGWKWIAVDIDFPYSHAHKMRQIQGAPVELTSEEQANKEALEAEYAKLEEEHGEDAIVPDDVLARLDEIESALDAYNDRPLTYDPADIARAGVYVSIGSDASLHVHRGFVRREDEPAVTAPHAAAQPPTAAPAGEDNAPATAAPAVQRAVITVGSPPEPADEEDEGAVKQLSEKLVGELTAFRTLALRDAVANNPHIAMTALLHKLCIETFRQHAFYNCLQVNVQEVHFPMTQAGFDETAPAKAVDVRHKAWLSELPKTDSALWDWLDALDNARRASLLAHCVSYGINALVDRNDRSGPYGMQRRIADADRLARAVALDPVAAGWQPTIANYLGRVSKLRILEAVREGKGEEAVHLIEHLKKTDMAKEAERLLAGSGWLPETLRTPDAADADMAVAPEDEFENLPEFLDGDDNGEDSQFDDHNFAAEA